ncbi:MULTISPECIES: DUF4373 domain-containing protein [Listeria]|uniref:DUF4373 domain-containing protein n=1 Tax=Listeria TaxID=1637 RepID=UPI000B58D3E0|nr:MULTISPECIES: DUF4373 domain-containing protein [Listeria]
MARPKKEGLDYFPLDVHIFEDEKIEAIAGEFGIKGELAVIKLLCAVYEKGYFAVWDELMKAKLLKRLPGTSKELLDQIVNRLVVWGFFDESLFNSAKVLTSSKIQATFSEATKRRKTRKPTLHWINVDNNNELREVNVNINPQSKVKESKVNKSKVNKSDKTNLQSDFSKLWQLYPRKERKEDAFKAYQKAIKEGVSNKEIQNGIMAYKQHLQAKNTEHQFIAQGGTWFYQRRWNDEYDMTTETKNNNTFRKNTKQEVLPDWFNKEEQATSPQSERSNEEKAVIAAEVEKIKKELGVKRNAES